MGKVIPLPTPPRAGLTAAETEYNAAVARGDRPAFEAALASLVTTHLAIYPKGIDDGHSRL